MLKLKVGKTYLNRRGMRTRIIYELKTAWPDRFIGVTEMPSGDDNAPYEDSDTFQPNGKFLQGGPGSPFDLVKECVKEK